MQETGIGPLFGKIPCRRKFLPNPVFLPGKSNGQRSLVGYSPWGHKRVGHDLAAKPEKAMAPHSSTLAWKIPWTEEPGRLQSMGSLGVGHDWATSLSLFTFIHWRRKWQPTPVFLPGESQGRGSLVGCHLCGRIELDTTATELNSTSLMYLLYILWCFYYPLLAKISGAEM